MKATSVSPHTERSPVRPGHGARAGRSGRGGALLLDEAGFTIVEVLVSALILIIGVLATVSVVDAANGATTAHKRREAATNLARDVVEQSGALAYDDVTPAKLATALQARPGLADSSADAGYTIDRRGVAYAVAVEACSLDDPHDGTGSHSTPSDGVPFCAGSGANGNSDTKPADYR